MLKKYGFWDYYAQFSIKERWFYNFCYSKNLFTYSNSVMNLLLACKVLERLIENFVRSWESLTSDGIRKYRKFWTNFRNLVSMTLATKKRSDWLTYLLTDLADWLTCLTDLIDWTDWTTETWLTDVNDWLTWLTDLTDQLT